MGTANVKEIYKFMQPDNTRDLEFQMVGKDAINQALTELMEEDTIVQIPIEGQKGIPDFALTDTINKTDDFKQYCFWKRI